MRQSGLFNRPVVIDVLEVGLMQRGIVGVRVQIVGMVLVVGVVQCCIVGVGVLVVRAVDDAVRGPSPSFDPVGLRAGVAIGRILVGGA